MAATSVARGYPADWRDVSHRVRARSGGRCECLGQCGLHHDRRCEERNGEPARWARGRIVLTVAHWPDHTPSNVSDDNLVAACQRCHLRMDRDLHAIHVAATHRRKRREAFAAAAAAGQVVLFGEVP